VEQVDDGLALVHVEGVPVVRFQKFLRCFEAYNIYSSDLPANPVVFRGTFELSASQPPFQVI
jgi:hypothetical protein